LAALQALVQNGWDATVATDRHGDSTSNGLKIVLGEPDMDALYRTAVVFERDSGRPFTPLLARFLSLWNGVEISESDGGSGTRAEPTIGGPDSCIWSGSLLQQAPDGWVIGSIYAAPIMLDTSSPDQTPIIWHDPDAEPRVIASSFEDFLGKWLAADLNEAELTR
jgi:hypothetical protein